MKITLLNQTYWPDPMATAQQLADLAEFLVREGHEVTVIAGRRGYEQRETIYPARETHGGVRILRVHSTGFGKRSFFSRLIDAVTFDLLLLFALIRLPKQDVVVSFTSPPLIGLFGALFCLAKGGRSVQWLMDLNPDSAIACGLIRERSCTGRFLTALFRFTLKQSDRLIVLDRWMKKRIVDHGTAPEKITIVPPWSVVETAAEAAVSFERNVFRRKNGLEGKFIILYSGNHSIVHPLDTVLESARLLRNDNEIQFVFMGSGLRTQDVKAFVSKHGLTNVTQLPLQPREVLKDSLSSADVHVVVMGQPMSGLVHTSKIYGVLATGKPHIFVGPGNSHVVDLLEECPYGYHVNHGDAAAFVETVKTIRGLSREELEQIRKANTTYVSTRFGRKGSLGAFLSAITPPPARLAKSDSVVMGNGRAS